MANSHRLIGSSQLGTNSRTRHFYIAKTRH